MPISTDWNRDRIEALERRLDAIEARLTGLEGRGGGVRVIAGRSPPLATSRTEPGASPAATGAVEPSRIALLGRSLVIVGGAYAFRVASESGALPPTAGAALAGVYAAGWLLAGDRSASRGARASALFHGITGLLIGSALVWETTTRLAWIGAGTGMLGLCALSGLAWVVAARRELGGLAATTLAAHVLVSLTVMLWEHAFAVATAALLFSAAAIEVGSGRWPRLRWPAAFAADLACGLLLGAAAHAAVGGAAHAETAAATAALLALPLLYVTSLAVRVRRGDPDVGVFDIAQSLAVLTLGVGGAAHVQLAAGGIPVAIGLGALLAGGLVHALALRTPKSTAANPGALLLRAVASGLVALGLGLGLPSTDVLAGASTALALLALAVGLRSELRDLCLHALLFAGIGFVGSGLARTAGEGLLIPAAGWGELGAAEVAVAVACTVAAGLALRCEPPAPAWPVRPTRIGLVAGALFAWIGLASRWVGEAWPAVGKSDAALAPVRTVLLCAAALALAAASRRHPLPELRGLVVATLAVGAAKIAFQEMRQGEPLALVVSLATFGSVLIATSRLLQRDSR